MATIIGTAKKDKLVGTNAGDIIKGLAGNDILSGGKGHDAIYAGTGNDSVNGGDGNDKLFGEAGHDTMLGGFGNDLLNGGIGNDKLFGEAGNDVLIGGLGADRMNGGLGVDRMAFASATGAISVNLLLGTGLLGEALGDTYAGIENVDGSAFGDTIIGDKSANVLNGGNGDDVISGGGGHDTLNGGAGADQLDGGDGNDVIYPGADTSADVIDGGNGHNTVNYSNQRNAINVQLSAITNVTVGTGGDTIKNVLSIIGTAFDDDLRPVLTGFADGGGGDDTLRSGSTAGAASLLIGGSGHDTLIGKAGAPTLFQLEYNNGADVVTNADFTGRDHFVVDHLAFDLAPGQLLDSIDLIYQQFGTFAVPDGPYAQFIWVDSLKQLYFDRDGTLGDFTPNLIATVPGLTIVDLDASDFFVV